MGVQNDVRLLWVEGRVGCGPVCTVTSTRRESSTAGLRRCRGPHAERVYVDVLRTSHWRVAEQCRHHSVGVFLCCSGEADGTVGHHPAVVVGWSCPWWVMLNVLRCQLTYLGQVVTNAEARFNKSVRPRKPEGSLGRTAQDVHLGSHTAPELCPSCPCLQAVVVAVEVVGKDSWPISVPKCWHGGQSTRGWNEGVSSNGTRPLAEGEGWEGRSWGRRGGRGWPTHLTLHASRTVPSGFGCSASR